MRRMLALLALVSLASCAPFEGKDDIASIAFSGRACPNCSDELVVRRDGTIEDTSSYQSPIRASVPKDAAAIIDSFPFEEFESATRYGQVPTVPGTFATIGVTFRDGRIASATVPTGAVLYPRNARLQRWLSFAAFEATNASFGRRTQAFDAALRGVRKERVRRVSLEMRGCFGACPRYVATFDANGTGTLRASGPHCARTTKVRMPFARILSALRRGGAPELRPSYDIQFVDTESARITVETTRATYISDAPDSASWERAFVGTQARLDQIVRDADWTPPIDLERCAGKPPFFRTV